LELKHGWQKTLPGRQATDVLLMTTMKVMLKPTVICTNWETATKVCPFGWHLPSEREWASLTTYLGGDSIAHIELKETGQSHWKEADSTVTNKSWFSAIPGGLYNDNSFKHRIEFQYIGNYGYWWSATTEPGEGNNLNACFRTLGDYYKNEKLDYATKSRGSSVRCIKD
jgi:uncharacterized protein (TIGR02145 family)